MRQITRNALALLIVVGACGGPSSSTPTPPSPNRSVITSDEIPTSGAESAYELIQRLRPEYFRVRPAQSYTNARSAEAPPPAVVVSGQRLGEITELRGIPASSLSSVRYYTIEEGKRKFGMQYGGGVVEIAYRTRPSM